MASTFESLPSELLSSVMKLFDKPAELHSLISASPRCLGLFSETPHVFLTPAILRSVSPEHLQLIIALLRMPSDVPGGERFARLKLVLDEYFAGSAKLDLIITKAELVQMCLLKSRVSRLVDSFFAKAMDWFATFDERVCNESQNADRPPQAPSPPHVTTTEKIRLERAFLRFELYCRAFPPGAENMDPENYSSQMQNELFLSHLELWEMEEMCCVYQYFASALGQAVDQMEIDIIEAVMASPGKEIGQILGDEESRDPPPDDLGPNELRYFEFLNRSHLYMFDQVNQEGIVDNISYMTSLGLHSNFEFQQADKADRFQFIKTHAPQTREFLPEALVCARNERTQAAYDGRVYHGLRNDDPVYNDPAVANCGYRIFKPSFVTGVLGIRGHSSFCLIREMGYVFWDSQRIMPPLVYRKFDIAQKLHYETGTRLFERGDSVADRLEGIKIPQCEFRRIEKEFGSIYLAERGYMMDYMDDDSDDFDMDEDTEEGTDDEGWN